MDGRLRNLSTCFNWNSHIPTNVLRFPLCPLFSLAFIHLQYCRERVGLGSNSGVDAMRLLSLSQSLSLFSKTMNISKFQLYQKWSTKNDYVGVLVSISFVYSSGQLCRKMISNVVTVPLSFIISYHPLLRGHLSKTYNGTIWSGHGHPFLLAQLYWAISYCLSLS